MQVSSVILLQIEYIQLEIQTNEVFGKIMLYTLFKGNICFLEIKSEHLNLSSSQDLVSTLSCSLCHCSYGKKSIPCGATDTGPQHINARSW